MSIGNPALADVLAQHGTPHRLLAALADGGVLVAVRPDRSVVLGTTQAGDRVLLGYTGPGSYARHRGCHSLSACDADTILDIQRVTGVREIVIDAAGPAAAAVPIDDLQRFLTSTRSGPTPVLSGAAPAAYATGAMATVSRGAPALAQVAPPAPESPPMPWIPAPRPHLSGPMQQVDPGYRRCTHPILPALRRAIAHLLADFPLVHHVWISEARTASGVPGIMLHVKVHMSAAEDVVRDLHRGVRARLPQFAASGAPILMARVADARSERRMIEIGAHVVCANVID
ncbi:hypothetical protein GCM10010149_01520 [Nonomuraea roseoviolacea subsp. roseoviolacea]|uniref:Uncharacterized protein n=1 Tax=Nonomuraea roseoviolacea subsp. carminata TaxID=160689 RepID=A0ABT1K495_9ACTN|nr:hypothetical protein [Nonomuraea roseoviolacea]MCP2348821.1 hypothetical protein [Nonomuraea roseoviolacea subsp. carminata]